MEAARRHEEFSSLGRQVARKRSSRKLEDMLAFHVAPDIFTDGATKRQLIQLHNASLQGQAAEGNSKKNLLMFLAKFQRSIASTVASDHQASPWFISRRVLVRECVELARRISRAAAVCFAPPSGAAADEDDDLPYMQLDKVTHALTRDAFGPLYLVT